MDKILLKEIQKTFKREHDKAMEKYGYVVISEKGYIIKKYKDGRIEKLNKI